MKSSLLVLGFALVGIVAANIEYERLPDGNITVFNGALKANFSLIDGYPTADFALASDKDSMVNKSYRFSFRTLNNASLENISLPFDAANDDFARVIALDDLNWFINATFIDEDLVVIYSATGLFSNDSDSNSSIIIAHVIHEDMAQWNYTLVITNYSAALNSSLVVFYRFEYYDIDNETGLLAPVDINATLLNASTVRLANGFFSTANNSQIVDFKGLDNISFAEAIKETKDIECPDNITNSSLKFICPEAGAVAFVACAPGVRAVFLCPAGMFCKEGDPDQLPCEAIPIVQALEDDLAIAKRIGIDFFGLSPQPEWALLSINNSAVNSSTIYATYPNFFNGTLISPSNSLGIDFDI